MAISAIARPRTYPMPSAIRTAISGCSRTLPDTASAWSRTTPAAPYMAASARPAASVTAGVTRSFISASTCSRSRAICDVASSALFIVVS